ncbi:Aminotransferase class V [Candidatus Nitrosotenuis uzonensis]|uniref:Aminotransferase class V n=2 Tax=Candidatus Nitrosotenuis uzonensis TaxID=1407055 RepID=V6AVS6_9ARCH|nr:Aminotransferase class V [Candidatus Nitrosotenuis uzonensis]
MKAMTDFMLQYNSLGPDSLDFAAVLTEKTSRLRDTISRLVGCRKEEVVLTQSTTEGINFVANGLEFDRDSNIVIRGTTHEHHANYFPWLRLGKKIQIRNISHDQNGFFQISEFENLLDDNTKLVALSHALYNTGAILPIDTVGKILEEKAIPYFVDTAQTVGCIGDYDFGKARYGFMAFNGYKWLCGPMGIGIFVCKKDVAALLEPTYLAGESAIAYDTDKLAYKDIPDKFQASYRNFVAIAGLESSISLLMHIGLQNIRDKIIRLANLMRDELRKIPGITVYGPENPQERTSIVSFSIEGQKSSDVVQKLEKQNVVVALREISELKIVRASPHFFNTDSEIQAVIDKIRRL